MNAPAAPDSEHATPALHETATTASRDDISSNTRDVIREDERRHDDDEDRIKYEHDDTDSDAVHATFTTLRPSPPASIKRRESQAADTTTVELGEKHGKKRKRAASPPWQFPTVEAATVKTADGRRVSARVGTATGTPVLSESDRPGRARSASQSVTRSRPASPPWKKFQAAGPTSIQIDGVRKSGRVNKDLSETPKPKRVSPRHKKTVDKLVTEPKSSARPGSRGDVEGVGGAVETKPKRQVKAEREQSPARRIAELQAQIAALNPSPSSDLPEHKIKSSERIHKRKHSHEAGDGVKKQAASSHVLRATNRTSTAALSPDAARPSPRIKLRFGTTSRTSIPPPHPHARCSPPAAPPRPSLYQVIEKYELLEMQQPYSENESGPPDAAEFRRRHARQALAEGETRRKLLEAMGPGGVYSRENLILLESAEQTEIPQQYGHGDHLVNHALYLRQLQLREKSTHRALAKKVALEALEYWKAMRGPTEEDLRTEEDRIFRLVYKQVVLDMRGKWDMVASHVQQLKQQEWEAEEDARRQEKLQRQLEQAEAMVAKQRGDDEGTEQSDEDDDLAAETDDGEAEAENMTESESESGDSEGADMSDDALAAYLAQRAAEPPDIDKDDVGDESDEGSGSSDASFHAMNGDLDDQADEREQSPPEEGTTQDLHPESDTFGQASEPIDAQAGVEDVFLTHSADAARPAIVPRRSRHSFSPLPAAIEEAVEADLSSDESIDMDSEDYDSDEDMSDSDDEVDAGSDGEADQSDIDQADRAERSTLGFLMDKKEIKSMGLPTPTTSAEGDASDRVHEVISDDCMEPRKDAQPDHITDQRQNGETGPEHEDLRLAEEQVEVAVPEIIVPAEHDETMHSPAEEPQSDTGVRSLVPVPTLLRGQLRSYQHAGLDWLASLYRQGNNGILADEMGLGKTIQTISLLAHMAEQHGVWEPHLVIVPTSVILNWVTEFQKFLPGFRVLGYYGSAEERVDKRKGWTNDPHHADRDKRGYNVVITSYNVATQDIAALRNQKWHCLVLDEAHNIRNFNSQRWQILIRLRTQARLLLTGTPLQNSLTELWSLLTFLTAGDPDSQHGELETFLNNWKEPVKEIFDRGVSALSAEAQKVVEKLHVLLRPVLLRRLKSEVEKDLPKKTEHVVVCKLSKRQRQLYQEYMGLASTRESLRKGNAVSAGAVLLSLRKVCNHPDLFDPRPIQTSFAMETSPLQPFSIKEALVRTLLGAKPGLPESLLVANREGKQRFGARRSQQLSAIAILEKEIRALEKTEQDASDASTIKACLAFQRLQKRGRKLQRLRESVRVTTAATGDAPIYGRDLRAMVAVRSGIPYTFTQRARLPQQQNVAKHKRAWPAIGNRAIQVDHLADWLLSQTTRLQHDVLSLERYADGLHGIIERFAFCPPVVTAPVLDYTIPSASQDLLRSSLSYPAATDYGHEARIRTSIAFPDSRLLMYDSGKLQRLQKLLRELQARGSRSLIFTQMTSTLNILERFLNLLNLPYLRLDGSTSVERRQLHAAEFNRPDSKYQCMILSSRAGGVGLNLTGASSVIFYDLDWNPQMDRQCMDRAHRIGQVRDVEVYKMVSEKTVEENILRRANQKSLLDQTVIQQGQFTTEYQLPPRVTAVDDEDEDDDVAKGIERFLGGGEKGMTQAIESVEDKEDVVAAQQAQKEELAGDDVDFAERPSTSRDSKGATTPAPVFGEGEDGMGHVDQYMVRWMQAMTKEHAFVPPAVRRLDKNNRDPSHRPKRKR